MSAVTVPSARSGSAPFQRPQLRVVGEPVRQRRFPWVVLLGLLLAGAVLLALTLTALAAEDAVLARELENDVTVAEREYARLVAEVATLESPERIADMAQRLGLVREAVLRPLPVERPLDSDGDDATEPLLAEGDGLKPLLTEER